MSLRKRPAFAGVILVAAVLPAAVGQTANAQMEQRVQALLAKMNQQEKIGQLNQLFVIPGDAPLPGMHKPTDDEIARGDYGAFLFVTDPAEINRMQHLAVDKSRLHIPLLFGFDVIHGFKTIFPVPIGMAASWDPAIAERAQAVAAREASAAGIRWAFGPMVDIARDPRWGRMVEGAGEDPYLGSAMARAQVRGFQGASLGEPGHVMTSVKHFAGYGAAVGGRDYDSSYIPEEELWNVYLPPFHAAVQAGSGTVMSAYMDLNDVPATGNRFLLRDVLRKAWGFDGFVVSDAFAVRDLATHGFAKDASDAAFRAFTAGVNMDMGSLTYGANLAGLISQGRITGKQLDEMVRPILAAKFKLGLFEKPYVEEAAVQAVFDAPDHSKVAREAAQRSAVLLRNEGGLLPLSLTGGTFKSIAVIGPLADSATDIQGSWALATDSAKAVSAFTGIREKVDQRVRVESAMGCEIRRVYPSMFDAIMGIKHSPALTDAQNTAEIQKAVDLAARSDVSILVLGEQQDMSGENASRSSIELPGREQELLEKVVAAGKPVVLVLLNGRPMHISWAAEHVPAILEAWYPGAEGGHAIADLLFGSVNPGGKLPVTFPRNSGQIPIYYAHNLTHQPETGETFTSRYWDVKTSPLYPFGYGLSYTTFTITDLKVSKASVKPGEEVEVSAAVRNTGKRSGDEVVQLYIHQQSGAASRPVRLLKGFERVTLQPDETRTVKFKLSREDLSYWSGEQKNWVEDEAAFDVWVGQDSMASLHGSFEVKQ